MYSITNVINPIVKVIIRKCIISNLFRKECIKECIPEYKDPYILMMRNKLNKCEFHYILVYILII